MMRALAVTLSGLARRWEPPRAEAVARALVIGTGDLSEIDRAVAFVDQRHPGAEVAVLCDPAQHRAGAQDSELPGVRGGGYGTLRRLRENPPDLVVVLWTGKPFSRPWKLLGAFGLLARHVWIMNENGDAFPLSRDHGAILFRHARWRWELARRAGYRVPWRAVPRLALLLPPLLVWTLGIKWSARRRLRGTAS